MKVWGIIFNFHGVGEGKRMECVWMDLNSMAHEDLRGKARLTATASQSHNQLLPGKSVLVKLDWRRDSNPQANFCIKIWSLKIPGGTAVMGCLSFLNYETMSHFRRILLYIEVFM